MSCYPYLVLFCKTLKNVIGKYHHDITIISHVLLHQLSKNYLKTLVAYQSDYYLFLNYIFQSFNKLFSIIRNYFKNLIWNRSGRLRRINSVLFYYNLSCLVCWSNGAYMFFNILSHYIGHIMKTWYQNIQI